MKIKIITTKKTLVQLHIKHVTYLNYITVFKVTKIRGVLVTQTHHTDNRLITIVVGGIGTINGTWDLVEREGILKFTCERKDGSPID